MTSAIAMAMARQQLLAVGAVLCCIALSGLPPTSATRPHIVFVIADDLGWNDVSFHGSSQVPTPHLDALARGGLILDNYYVQPVCSPTRSSILSGRHVIHTGVYGPFSSVYNSGALNATCNVHPTLECQLLPLKLRQLGYATHMVGKWHLGWYDWSITPLGRGFDSFYGYFQGDEDYYNHTVGGEIGKTSGYDFWNDSAVDWDASAGTAAPAIEKYSTTLFTERAVQLIQTAASSVLQQQQQQQQQQQPLFLYLAYQAIHSPMQAPSECTAPFIGGGGTEPAARLTGDRLTTAGMIHCMDVGVGKVVDALRSGGPHALYPDTLLVFTSDNGGPTCEDVGNPANASQVQKTKFACYGSGSSSSSKDAYTHASNMPLRGRKATYWEGGLRAAGFIHGVGLRPNQIGAISHASLHACDWYFTILHAAAEGIGGSEAREAVSQAALRVAAGLGGDGQPPFNHPTPADGMDVWEALSRGAGGGALSGPRNETLHVAKLVNRSGEHSGHGAQEEVVVMGVLRRGDWKLFKGTMHTKPQMYKGFWYATPGQSFVNPNLTIQCGEPPSSDDNVSRCIDSARPCLFNIRLDPCEHLDVAALPQHAGLVQEMEARLAMYAADSAPSDRVRVAIPTFPKCTPALNGHGAYYPCAGAPPSIV